MATLVQATTIAVTHWRYASKVIFTMPKIETKAVPTMGVDKSWRLYYNPETLAEWEPGEAAGVVLHEYLHIALRHAERYQTLFGTEVKYHIPWNYATDLAINSLLVSEGVKLPKGGLLPAQFDLEDGQTAEWYLSRLLKNHVQWVELPSFGGSCSDGMQREWEQGGDVEGVPDELQDVIRAQAANDVKRDRGNEPGGLRGVIDNAVKPPRSLVSRALRNIRGSLDEVAGCDRRSYRRPSRRSRPELLLPRYYGYCPDVTVVVDTSGSMGKHDRAKALGVINTVMSTLGCRSGVKVMMGDTKPHKIERVYKQVRSMEDVGYGGTDMGVLVEEAAKGNPDLILVVTDGYTGWPSGDVGSPTIACLTQKTGDSVPEWIKKLDLSS